LERSKRAITWWRVLAVPGPLGWTAIGVVLLWQGIITLGRLETIVMPSPLLVATDLFAHPGAYLPDALSTVQVALLGLCFGMALGTLAAVFTASSSILSGLVTPAALVMRSVPVVAMIPVIARVLGYNERSLVAIATIIAFFPSFVLVGSGLRHLPPGAGDVFAVLGARPWTRLWRLALPSAVPNLLVALRLSAHLCVLGAVAAEYLMGTRGLGKLLVQSRADGIPERSWGVAVLATALSVTAFLCATRFERWGRERWT
jgi:ABC-type nitrate/sulfonate/bicarbonate transport system permease component